MEVWDKLEVIHEGTKDVKETKISLLNLEYENFKMKSNKDIKIMFDQFSAIVNQLKGFGKEISEDKLVQKQEGKEDQGITFVQVRFYCYDCMYKQWGGSVFCIFGLEYRYSSVVSVPEFNTGIRVSVLLDEYSSLKHDSLCLGP
ncbi:hypothetical protein GQ457_13G015330 [Hibiscus cannabinus]